MTLERPVIQMKSTISNSRCHVDLKIWGIHWGISQKKSLSFWHIPENINWPNVASNEIDKISEFDNSFLFCTKQNALRQFFFNTWISIDFLWFFVGSMKKVHWCLFEHADTRNLVHEYSGSYVRVFLGILAYLAHAYFLILNRINEWIFWYMSENANMSVSRAVHLWECFLVF